MDELKTRTGWRSWLCFAPLFLSYLKDRLREEVSFFKGISWKSRLWAVAIYLAFLAGLLAGVWQIAVGFYEGPNFAAARIVVVDAIAEWHSAGRHNTDYTSWTLEYHFVSSNGENISRSIQVNADDPAASLLRHANAGDELLLRVGVPAGEPGAKFGFNKVVRQGLGTVLLLLILWHFSRQDFLEIDADSGQVVPAKGRLIKFLLVFFGAMFGLLWLTSPVIP